MSYSRASMLVALCLGLAAPAWGQNTSVSYVGGDFMRGLGYTGTGVRIGVIDEYEADSSQPAIHGNFIGAINFYSSRNAMLGDHATEVTGTAVSQDATYPGMAPQAAWWSGQTVNRREFTSLRIQTEAAETFARGLGSLNGQPVDVITMSIGLLAPQNITPDSSGTDQWSLGLDHIVNQNGVTVTVAAGNSGPGSMTIDGTPAGAYNIITVGATGGTGANISQDYSQIAPYSSLGPTTDGRCKPDIVAPGSLIHAPTLNGAWADVSGTSFATPMVAGGAAQLINMGMQLGHSTDPRVIKSVLLNSADKLAGWTHTSTHPLDYNQGAGQMDLHMAYRQYLDQSQAPGQVRGIGWDYHDQAYGASNLYTMNRPLPAGAVIAATLTWNRVVSTDTEDIDTCTYSVSRFHDLNLQLYGADNLSMPVDSSISSVDNVEHIYFSVPQAGSFALGVQMADGAPGQAETYSLAWRVAPGVGMDYGGDANLDGVVDVNDLTLLATNWRATGMTWFDGDFNNDGVVDVMDLTRLATYWRTTAPWKSAAIPEPVGLSILIMGGLLVLRRRRSR